ncbi:glycosyltransferase family 4 protein [Natronosalvus vescus]|uniref:glycosyltransferase family 4 protein n=1 Tax=Natronosalvus vescus TaxID=2953881 RepID=UPI0020916340|nr:glycosyltransferase family 4 protein [Natronosalvus vescus]
MRVLTYLELERALQRSGIGTAAAQQRRALTRLRERARADGGDDELPVDPVDLEVCTDPWGGSLAGVPVRLFRDSLPIAVHDVVHCNAIGPGSLAVARYANRHGIPLVLHAHVTREDFRGSFRGSNTLAGPLGRYLRYMYSRADLVCCPSEQTKRHLEAYPVDAPIEPITNGVDHASLEGVDRLREPARDRFSLAADDLVVFAVGNVFERKGLSTFCRLAVRMPYEFVWFGPYDSGPQASPVVRHWTENPPPNVTFTGWVDDKREAFAAGDVFLFPTHAENQGIAVLEAMACGKAVVLRDLPVFREFYTDGVDCLFCSSEREFRGALERLAANPGLRERLGEAAQETAAEHRLERVGERLLEVYDRAIDEHGR